MKKYILPNGIKINADEVVGEPVHYVDDLTGLQYFYIHFCWKGSLTMQGECKLIEESEE
jgi:hypothetical protein